ncbi:hypothetical protein J132_00060 [Termitomyces sp. J132]|nr:hypothetical protein J132_00060 [Termitomyces sp. J132]
MCTVIQPDQKDWLSQIALMEFVINTSISEMTCFALFELNGGYMPLVILEIRSDAAIPRGIQWFAQQALENLAAAHDTIIEACIFQMHLANLHCKPDPELEKGALVYFLTKNLNLPKGRARMLCPKWVGPYKILEAYSETSNYVLELPMAL